MEKITNSFNITTNDVIEDEGIFYLTIKQIAESLDATKRNIRQILVRHKDEFESLGKGGSIRIPLKTAGGQQMGYVLNEEQIYLLSMLMIKNEKARGLRRHLVDLLSEIKNEKFLLKANAQATANKKLLLEIAELREDLASAELNLVCAKSKINTAKKGRYLLFRRMELSRGEATRALKIPYKAGAALEKLLNELGEARATRIKLNHGEKLGREEQFRLLRGYDTSKIYKLVTNA